MKIPNFRFQKDKNHKHLSAINNSLLTIYNYKVREINLTADELVEKLVYFDEVCLLDSCGVNHLDSHLLVAGIKPFERIEITNDDAEKTLISLNEKLSNPNYFNIFTLSYDFGLKLEKIISQHVSDEPDVFLATFDVLIIHDYYTKKTFLIGDEKKFDEIEKLINSVTQQLCNSATSINSVQSVNSETYEKTIEEIQELIRQGETYQTNLTRKIEIIWQEKPSAEKFFLNLRKNHPAPFASFIKRLNSTVISASPERFFKVENGEISTSPIKGTRPRGKTETEDLQLRNELLSSEKDLAENVMIVDLLRNDIGRICEFGTVKVEKLCDLESHPSLFHLVSTITGTLRKSIKFSDLLKATFPCGSITGCPKISTMKIIDKLENSARGLSMGAIGLRIADCGLQIFNEKILNSQLSTQDYFSLNVAIRTMVIRENIGVFNVGGGIVIDSNPQNEFEETVVKSKALLDSIEI